jgi:hypothetical protein
MKVIFENQELQTMIDTLSSIDKGNVGELYFKVMSTANGFNYLEDTSGTKPYDGILDFGSGYWPAKIQVKTVLGTESKEEGVSVFHLYTQARLFDREENKMKTIKVPYSTDDVDLFYLFDMRKGYGFLMAPNENLSIRIRKEKPKNNQKNITMEELVRFENVVLKIKEKFKKKK